ncbi:MAG: TIGR02391 family protein [Pigmentiphaga sp.]
MEASFKEVNDAVKRILRETDGRELDGAGLMTTAFSSQSPIIRLSALVTDTDKSIQQGYMQIFAGSMTGIRNPKAHGNLSPDRTKTLHLISLASLLMHKVDERYE